MKKLFNKINEKPRLKKVLKLLGVIGICLSVAFNGLIIGVAIAEKCRNNNDNTINNVATTPIKEVYYPGGMNGNPLWIPYTLFFDNYYWDNPTGFRTWATTQFNGFDNSTVLSNYSDISMPTNTLFVDVDPEAYHVYLQNGGVGINYLTSNTLSVNYLRLYKVDDTSLRTYGNIYAFFFNTNNSALRPYYTLVQYGGIMGGKVYNSPSSNNYELGSLTRGIMITSGNPLYNVFNRDYENASQSYDEGYRDGYNEGYNWGKDTGINDGYRDGYATGSSEGYSNGYQVGITENMEDADWSPFTLLSSAFNAVADVLNINILPGMSLGLLVFIPIIVAVIIVVVKMIKG